MAYLYVHGPCVACGTLMAYNPACVPSIRVGGSREPLCRGCFTTWNQIHRTSRGFAPLPLHPEAYEPLECDA